MVKCVSIGIAIALTSSVCGAQSGSPVVSPRAHRTSPCVDTLASPANRCVRDTTRTGDSAQTSRAHVAALPAKDPVFVISKSGTVYARADCPGAVRIPLADLKIFEDEDAARSAGYVGTVVSTKCPVPVVPTK